MPDEGGTAAADHWVSIGSVVVGLRMLGEQRPPLERGDAAACGILRSLGLSREDVPVLQSELTGHDVEALTMGDGDVLGT